MVKVLTVLAEATPVVAVAVVLAEAVAKVSVVQLLVMAALTVAVVVAQDHNPAIREEAVLLERFVLFGPALLVPSRQLA
jgi:hypothetical protein